MKISHSLLLLSLLCMSIGFANAGTKTAGTNKMTDKFFRDNFFVEGATIVNVHTEDNLVITTKSNQTFTVAARDPNYGKGGLIKLFVEENRSVCELTIEDGIYQMNPSVSQATCHKGLYYSGMEHQYGSYNYVLKFQK